MRRYAAALCTPLLSSCSFLRSAMFPATTIRRYFAHSTRNRGVSRSYLNSLAYILPMMYSIFVCSIFANYSVSSIKLNILSILMATPISIRQIWIGKSLAVTIPSVGIGIVVSFIAFSLSTRPLLFRRPAFSSSPTGRR